jgi:hypothetical protein
VFEISEAIALAAPLTCSEYSAYLKLCIHHLVKAIHADNTLHIRGRPFEEKKRK